MAKIKIYYKGDASPLIVRVHFMSKEFDEKFYNRFFVNLRFESKKRLYELIMRQRKLDLEDLEGVISDDEEVE